MKRAQVYMDDDEFEAVRVEAFKRHTSLSSVFRHLVRVNIMREPKQVKDRYAANLDAIIGMVHDPKPDVAERHDDYLWGEAE